MLILAYKACGASIEIICAPARIRTWDPISISDVLYQLSYKRMNTTLPRNTPLNKRKTAQRAAFPNTISVFKSKEVTAFKALECTPLMHYPYVWYGSFSAVKILRVITPSVSEVRNFCLNPHMQDSNDRQGILVTSRRTY